MEGLPGWNCCQSSWHAQCEGVNWAGGSVTFHCDNVTVVAVVNSGYSRVSEIMHLL